ncbi:type II secretion system protein [Luteimonas sp BLCC-B24]|uniref:type II secretion system protein n=1 Tax=Luteimonas sp. BLCC-B24 TaxID=3025317 RepID=UPI00234E12E9|nr:type II secretion system protein [Luteimonas sp. BLCC-B24]MDC7805921.1 type II secretion system protein [Luteimonas sp. BLCC-B24]
MRRPRRPSSVRIAAGGFTLVELSVVLAVLGVMAVAMTSAFGGIHQAREQSAARAQAETARQALRAFALRNKRLPCPDTSAHGDSGREAGGGSCNADVRIGWLPYESLGLDVPTRAERLRYGVYRSAVGADLVAPQAAGAEEHDFEGMAGFITALTAATVAASSPVQPYYVAYTGSHTCMASPIAPLVNPAFVVVVPATDRDGTGTNFDGDTHHGFATGSTTCVSAPDRAADMAYDDVVVAESQAALLGWLMTTRR